MVRGIGQLEPRPMAGITNAYTPFFSPDSQWIGFFENGELKKVAVTGGRVSTLCRVMGLSLGASWGVENTYCVRHRRPEHWSLACVRRRWRPQGVDETGRRAVGERPRFPVGAAERARRAVSQLRRQARETKPSSPSWIRGRDTGKSSCVEAARPSTSIRQSQNKAPRRAQARLAI